MRLKSLKIPKYKNIKVVQSGAVFDSKAEARYMAQLELLKTASNPSQKVSKIERQVKFELIPKQDGERATGYLADFVVTYADGRVEVVDVKSAFTRKLSAYVIKRKLMLWVHSIRVKEVL